MHVEKGWVEFDKMKDFYFQMLIPAIFVTYSRTSELLYLSI